MVTQTENSLLQCPPLALPANYKVSKNRISSLDAILFFFFFFSFFSFFFFFIYILILYFQDIQRGNWFVKSIETLGFKTSYRRKEDVIRWSTTVKMPSNGGFLVVVIFCCMWLIPRDSAGLFSVN
jgi:hypothetical protein